jgi:hypothetical protein
MLWLRRVAVTVISCSASEELSVLLAAGSAAHAPKDALPKIAAIAKESFEFIVIPLCVVERAINQGDMSRLPYLPSRKVETQRKRFLRIISYLSVC